MLRDAEKQRSGTPCSGTVPGAAEAMRRFVRLTAFMLAAAAAAAMPQVRSSPAIAPVVSGTAHQALFAIAVDGSRAMAVGASGAILSSDDSGKNWRVNDNPPTSLSLLGLAMSRQCTLAVGQEGLILKKTGEKWKTVKSGTDQRLFSVAVNAKGQAAAVGGFGTVLTSSDCGENWSAVSPRWAGYAEDGVEPHIYAVAVDAGGGITIAGEFGLILHSADSGKNWSLLHKGDASIFSLQLRDDGIGYAVGQSGCILRTADHGASWSALDSGSGAILLGVSSAPGGHVVVTGMREMLESGDDGKSWTHLADGDVRTAWYEGIGQSGPAAPVLAVGHSGRIIRVGG